MFHFPPFPPHCLYIQQQVPAHNYWWVSPFGHPRITGRLPPPRGLTQTPTSFIGFLCPGIHRAPLKTLRTQKMNTKTKTEKIYFEQICKKNCLQDARVHYAVDKQQSQTPTSSPKQQTSKSQKQKPKKSHNPTVRFHHPHNTNSLPTKKSVLTISITQTVPIY